ncbi:MAG: hypothetical protein AB7F65_02150 [Dehalococcoidia bacterium]
MPSLQELVEQAGPENPLAPYLTAILDAGLVVTLRDGAGRFAAPSPDFAEAFGRRGDERLAVGLPFLEGQRFFDEHGHELTRTEHPAQIVRRTGVPQRQRILGIRTARGEDAWMLVSYLPINATSEGWEVLGVGSLLRRSVFRPPTQEPDGQLPWAQELLAFALEVAGHRYAPDDLATRLKAPGSAITQAPTSLSLMRREGDSLHPTPIMRYGKHPLVDPIRMSDHARDRWDSERTCYIPDLQPTDIVGDRVVIEYEDPVRSLALVPIWDGPRRVASFVASTPLPHALSPQQLAALEALGRLAGPALACPEAA